jgi:hypothetical protein
LREDPVYRQKQAERCKKNYRMHRKERVEYMKAYYRTHHDERTAYARKVRYVNIDTVREIEREKRRTHQNDPAYAERNIAHNAVGNAKRKSLLVKKACLICGRIDVQAHHENYAKPLDIIWLCKEHHIERHYEIRRTVPTRNVGGWIEIKNLIKDLLALERLQRDTWDESA